MSDFKLTEKQKADLVKQLSPLINSSCERCNKKEWVASDTIFELREFQGGNLVMGGNSAILPVLPVTCKSCGHVIFFNALTLGIINQKKRNEQK